MIALRCTYCHDALVAREAWYCATCLAPHHHDCHLAHAGCAVPGCDEKTTVRPRSLGRRLPRMREARERPRQAVPWLAAAAGVLAGYAVIAAGYFGGDALRSAVGTHAPHGHVTGRVGADGERVVRGWTCQGECLRGR